MINWRYRKCVSQSNEVQNLRSISIRYKGEAFSVRAKHSENKLGKKPIINRPNASPLLGKKPMINRPNASPLHGKKPIICTSREWELLFYFHSPIILDNIGYY
ncbi:hypothetical protein FJR38_09355 [Anabaena sp. UHCC 0253]|nr:hypothetical protein [Anabaena sp. UHCC 0253]